MKILQENTYCQHPFAYSRWKTKEVKVGDVGIGGHNPIRIQSMTTTHTLDTAATVAQSIRMIEAGCELVRITAPSLKEAENLAVIKKELLAKGYQTPLVADIHFTPNAAEMAARLVEKVRINPGNYADKKKFEEHDYTDAAYNEELERIREKFLPLIRICKQYGTAMRIGTNHGSLSDRILSRYGDTPLGMVESAMEFLRICRDENYHSIVLSMKASNTQVMVEAYRLLVNKMMENEMHYPLHLGVTEAGDGEDGRIKSAVGIGALLHDGLGDTIRVSLTEEPEYEIPVARTLVEQFSTRKETHKKIESIALPYSPFSYQRRSTKEVYTIGGEQVPRVVGDLSHVEKITPASLFPFGYRYAVEADKWHISDSACDFIFTGNRVPEFELPGTLGIICAHSTWRLHQQKKQYFPLVSVIEIQADTLFSDTLNFIHGSAADISAFMLKREFSAVPVVYVLEALEGENIQEMRLAFVRFMQQKNTSPIIIKRNYAQHTSEQFMLYAGSDIGALLIDGLGDGIWLSASREVPGMLLNNTAFGILQASRMRISKTEYISCPSCGRTLFDLQETTANIRAVTHHLKGVKIGIMGCIVNGPGEMADADYGYVGTGKGKITLYKKKEVVQKNIDEKDAVEALIALIKEHGDWQEPILIETNNDE